MNFTIASNTGRQCQVLWPKRCLRDLRKGSPTKATYNERYPLNVRFLNSDVDYRLDGGITEGVWIFCRHGDRTPGRVLSPGHNQNKEGAFWVSRLPYPDTKSAFADFCKYFPPDVHVGTNQGQFMDSKRNPFGFLTRKGLRQLKENGHRFFNRYKRENAHNLPEKDEGKYETANDFLEAWDIKVFSTNYMRTIMSAQSFLEGLLGTHCFAPSLERKLDPYLSKEISVPDHKWVRDTFFHNDRQRKQHMIPIKVRELHKDPLNAFDRNPDMMADLVGDVMKGRSFNARDSAAAPLAGRLSNILPGLVRLHRSSFASRAPSGINWVEAADHFLCRESHNLPLSKFSNFEMDDRVEQTLKAMSSQTKAHLSWRFRKWYQSKPLLAAIAAPPLREIVDQMKIIISSSSSSSQTTNNVAAKKRPFVLYSCHDVTILGLLYGIGASFLADETAPGADYWPPYASTLVFELVRTNNGDFVIRILVCDGGIVSHIIECVDFDDQNLAKLGFGSGGMMRVEDLENIVEKHEDTGYCAKL